VGDGVVDGPVEGAQEIEQARGDADELTSINAWREVGRESLDLSFAGGVAVAFDADVDVGYVEDAHWGKGRRVGGSVSAGRWQILGRT